jgi:hypothetical protein
VASLVFALTAFFAISSLCSTVLDHAKGKQERTEGAKYDFVPVLIFVFMLMGWSLYANYQASIEASKEVAELVRVDVYEKSKEAISPFSDERKRLNVKLDKLLGGKIGGYGWKDKKGLFHLNRSGKELQRSISDEMKALGEREREILNAQKESIERKNSQGDRIEEVSRMGFTYVVFLAYPLCILLTFFTSSYSDEVISRENETREASYLLSEYSHLSGEGKTEGKLGNSLQSERRERKDASENRKAILSYLSAKPGASNQEVSKKLGLSIRTVRKYRNEQ